MVDDELIESFTPDARSLDAVGISSRILFCNRADPPEMHQAVLQNLYDLGYRRPLVDGETVLVLKVRVTDKSISVTSWNT